ncbi:2-amino-4-hydroxy-6-hydroxymethyldihydropteridine diphosphokinase [Thetidibacter halocola]|uniref:2-amino-4-hydroxy-6-hydroxymethyldihydropteridine pyrophosphokinase n=1 Tax=Thetidibacter halocola TaxID=2827239 RepID=A0A8J7WGH4_9RHOB|nr:2-amino-4-hydroxy-6-hydroxymethyldihydropteridine diphosphokinase [Thetidibacter halocola]MBS0126372.1 2-amino-4-hydroxy-6-hydroxymethyldihydropteridine diphosphokinase [Thetidibacter halocola]
MIRQEYLIAMGSNLGSTAGDAAPTLAAALGEFPREGAQLMRVSRFFRTPCFPAGAGPDYVNAAVALRWEGGAEALLAALHRIEAAFDRQRTARWAARTLDLDLLAAGDAVLPDRETFGRWQGLPPEEQRRLAPDRLILPHPRMAERAFVLVPLCDIAPGWRHPVLDRSARQLCNDLPAPERAAVVPL